jgi:CheY-like chemotaxis protein
MGIDEIKTVLVVENNPADARLAQEAFSDFDDVKLHLSRDGEDALDFLDKEGAYADAPRPDLVLLDDTQSKVDGNTILVHIKTDTDLKAIPTVVLTSSSSDADRENAMRHGANAFFTKPIFYAPFEFLIRCIFKFWLAKISRAKP